MAYNVPLASATGFGLIKLTGDLDGYAHSPSVIRLRGFNVSATTPTDGYVLTWVDANSDWEPKPASSGSFTAGGDLTGSSSSQQVVTLTGSGGTLSIATTGATVQWVTGTSTPTVKQADNTTNGATAQTLTMQAQNATGTTSTGGQLSLKSGTGTTAAGEIRFSIGSNLAGYYDANRVFRTGRAASSSASLWGGSYPGTLDNIFINETSNNTSHLVVNANASGTSYNAIVNASAGASTTTGITLYAPGATYSTTAYRSNAVIEHTGGSTSALLFSTVSGAYTGLAIKGRLYQSGALALGDAANNDTSTEAQAGLTGAVLNMSSSTGTMTSTAGQSLYFNQSGSAHLQGASDVRFDVGANLAGYFDSNRTFRFGTSAASTATYYAATSMPQSTDSFYLYNSAASSTQRTISGLNSGLSVIDCANTGTASGTVAIALVGAGTTYSGVAAWTGNAVIEQTGASTSAIVFSKLLGDASGRAVTGRLFQSGAFCIGDAANNDTSSEAQAGLTGAVINISSGTGTMTSASNQALLFNQSGSVHLQGNSDVRFDVAANLAGYFDSNRTFRFGATPTTAVSIFGGSFPTSSDHQFANGSSTSVRWFSSSTSGAASLTIANSGASGGGLIFVAGGSASGADFQSNGFIEQVGTSTSSLVFSKIQQDGSGRTTTGRFYQSGAFALGNATNNDTSTEAQAGLTGTLINLSAATGTVTSTANQALVYNIAGVGTLQGHSGVKLFVNTSSILEAASASITANQAIITAGISAPSTSSSGQGKIYFDSTHNRLFISENTGNYLNLLGADRSVWSSNFTANVTVNDGYDFIPVNTTGGVVTVTLPSSPKTGKTYTVADVSGTANTNNITVAGNGKNINGVSSQTISTNYGTLTITYNGSGWNIN